MNVPTPDVMYAPWRDVDLNVASTIGPDSESVLLRAVKSPLITWIWIGGLITALGAICALTPSQHRVAATRRAGADAHAHERVDA